MVSVANISASNSKFENLRWTPYMQGVMQIYMSQIRRVQSTDSIREAQVGDALFAAFKFNGSSQEDVFHFARLVLTKLIMNG